MKIPDEISSDTFGREDIVRQIFDRLFSNSQQGPQSCTLIGPPFIGKSRILKSVIRSELRKQFTSSSRTIDFVYADCITSSLTREDAVRALILCAMSSEYMSDARNENLLRDSMSLLDLQSIFERLLKKLQNSHVSLVFVLDHFDRYLSLFTLADIQFLRDVFSTTQHALVIALPRPLRDLTSKAYSSKFDLIFTPLSVKCFTINQSKEFIIQRSDISNINLTDQEIELVITKCGCHPHFLDIYSSALFDLKKDTREFSEADVDQLALPHLREDFFQIWQDMGEELQALLSDFARGYLLASASDSINTLQKLEYQYGVVYKTKNGYYEIHGELLRDFILTQSELIAKLSRTDYYRAGARVLTKLNNGQYLGTDPLIYYKEAFELLSQEQPDFKNVCDMIRSAFEQFIDAMVKNAEPRIQRLYVGETVDDMIRFLGDAVEVDEHTWNFVRSYWDILKSSNIGEHRATNLGNCVFRFYLLSATIQLFVNAGFKNLVFSNENVFDSEYESIEVLSETDHSLVRKARHRKIRTRYVVAKSILTKGFSSGGVLTLSDRLLREAEIIAGLDHPNIGKVYHVIIDPATVIMQWIDGIPLDDIKNKLDEHDVVSIAQKLSGALNYIHQKNVFHRDIKPSNVILRNSGDPVLVDFDIARSELHSTITGADNASSTYVGTPSYSAPEQWDSPNKVDGKSDVFSLGVVIYELLTGDLPYKNGNNPNNYKEHSLPKLELPDSHSYDLYQILNRMLSQDPDLRPDAASLEIEFNSQIQSFH